MSHLGYILILTTFVSTLGTALMGLLAGRTGREGFYRAARAGVFATAFLFTAAAAIMLYQLWVGDYSNKYVAAVTEHAMPWYYRLAAFWGSETGALLFWSWILSIICAAVVYENRGDKNRMLMPYVIMVLMLALGFFNMVMAFKANPFARFLSMAPPFDGRGVNPLLRHPLMVIHPPCLLIGYMGFTVPFAFAVASLITARWNDAWIEAARKYTVIAWIFLTCGLLLGGMWAYQELGWGGFWMWDPVENAALIPWFTGTAYLHSSMIQERRGMLRIWNITLVLLTFFLTIFGTFLTRSQIIKSVHSFGESLLGGDFLIYMGVIALVSIGLIAWRYKKLRSTQTIDHLFSREAFFVLNNWVLVGAALIVTWGTLFPKISDLASVRHGYNSVVGWLNGTFGMQMERLTSAVDLGESWFNKVMSPLGIFLLLLTGVGPLISWRKATGTNFRRHFLYPGLVSLAVVIGGLYRVLRDVNADGLGARITTWWRGGGLSDLYGVLAIAVAVFVLLVTLMEFYRGARVIKHRRGGGWALSMLRLLSQSNRRYGGYIIHIGVVFLYLGFAGAAFKTQTDWVRVSEGATVSIGSYRMTYVSSTVDADREKTMLISRVVITEGKQAVPRAVETKLSQFLKRIGYGTFTLEPATGPVLHLRFGKKLETENFVWLTRFYSDVYQRLDSSKLTRDPKQRLVGIILSGQNPNENEKERRQTLRRYRFVGVTLQQAVQRFYGKDPQIQVAINPQPLQLWVKVGDAEAYRVLESLLGAAKELDGLVYSAATRGLSTDLVQHGRLTTPPTVGFSLVVRGVGRLLEPAIFRFAKHQMSTTEVAIWSRLTEDLYLTSKGVDANNQLLLKAFINPLVSGMWLGGLLMIIGSLMAIWPSAMGGVRAVAQRRRRRKKGLPERDASPGDKGESA